MFYLITSTSLYFPGKTGATSKDRKKHHQGNIGSYAHPIELMKSKVSKLVQWEKKILNSRPGNALSSITKEITVNFQVL